MARWFTILGAASGFMAVAAGAFGAHSLRDSLAPRMLEAFEIGARYQMYHSLALFAVAWMTQQRPRASFVAGVSFVAGIVLFSGSLYAYAATSVSQLAMVTPLGGLCFLFGWAALVWCGWKLRRN